LHKTKVDKLSDLEIIKVEKANISNTIKKGLGHEVTPDAKTKTKTAAAKITAKTVATKSGEAEQIK
jgi:hypothetical protein